MAQIWDYIATYNPTGFYEDNRSKTLKNDYMDRQISAANMKNAREKKIMDLQDAWANGDEEALRQIGIYSPETSKKYMENTDEMLNLMRPVAQSVLQASPENREKAYQQFIQFGKKHNVDMSDVSPNYDEGFITTLANSDPQKIRDDRLNEQAEQRAQNQFNRNLAQLQYQNKLANDKAEAERQRRLVALEEEKENMTPQQYAAARAAIKGVDYTPQTPVEQLTAEYFDVNTTPERRAQISSLVSEYTAMQRKNTEPKEVIANRDYEEWERNNPDATEADKRNYRVQHGIENADDKVWIEQKKQQAKDDMGFIIGEGFANSPEEAVTILGLDKDTSPVGQEISKGLTSFSQPKESNRNEIMKGLTGIKKVDQAYLKKAGENIAKQEEDAKFIAQQKASLLPALIDAYKAAEDGDGLGVISGRVTPYVSKEKAATNLAAVDNLKNMVGPVMVAKLKAAGAGARSFDSEGERKAYLPDFSVTQSPTMIKKRIKEFAKKMLDIDIDEELKKSGNTNETVIDFTEYFKGE